MPKDKERDEGKEGKRKYSLKRKRGRGDECRGGRAGMIIRALTVNTERWMKRMTVFVTRKSEQRALRAWKINYKKYFILCKARIESLFLSTTDLCAVGRT